MSWLAETGLSLPNDWERVRLSQVADVLFSNVDKHTLDEETPVRLCNYVDVYKNEEITSSIAFMEASAQASEIQRFQIQPGDVLATKDSETPDDIAIPAFVAEPLPGVLCGYHLAMIRPRSRRVRGDFLFWLHASKEFRGQYEREAVGVTRFGLSQHSFLAAELPLPLVDEQQRIAAYLDASCRLIDAAVSAKRRQVDVLAQLARQTIVRAVTEGIEKAEMFGNSDLSYPREAPRHWRRTKLRYEISISNGDFATDKLDDAGSYPVMGGNGVMGRAEVFNMDGEFVVVGRVGAQCGNAHYFNGKAWVSDNALIVQSKHNMRFIAKLIEALDFNSTAKKTAQPLVTGTQVKGAYVSLPSMIEQDAIVSFIDQRNAEFEVLGNCIYSQIETLTDFRKSLIHECVTGQRRITEKDVQRVAAHAASAIA